MVLLLCTEAQSGSFNEKWLALSSTPIVDPTPVDPNSMFCEVINGYVSLYGEVAAEKWARKHKWSEKRISEAKKCRMVKSS